MKRFLISIVLASVMLSASAFAGPSAKFAATWGYGPSVVSVAYVADTSEDALDLDANAGYTLATIKVPQDKELLVGVSAEIGILTDTSIKGKNGGAARSIAGAGALVIVGAVPTGGSVFGPGVVAEPGPVVLSARVQVLDATLGGVIESCEDFTGGTDVNGLNPGDPGYIDTPDGVIDVKTECIVSDEEIGLFIGTLAAHHFNFVLPDMDQGEYDIVAWFITGALAAVDIDEISIIEGGSVSGSAFALAAIGKHMVTVQQVRAVKGSLGDTEIIEP
jgi:hypothetical protein